MSSFGPAGTDLLVSQVISAWIARLTDLLHSKTGINPTVRHTKAVYPDYIAVVWWQCDVAGCTTSVFVGASDSSWRAIANLLEVSSTEEADAKRAYLKLLDESFDSNGIEIRREPQSKHREIVEICFPDSEPIRLQFLGEVKSGSPHSAFDLLSDIELPITIRFGEARMLLQELIAVEVNSTIEFDRRVNDPVEILVNGRVVARGEAVVVRGNYGVRIIEFADRQQRRETLAASIPKTGSENRGD